MTQDEFIKAVAKLVTGLQVPSSIGGSSVLGSAYEPWRQLLTLVNGGFGWTNADACEEAFRKVLQP